jgi:uridine kinase
MFYNSIDKGIYTKIVTKEKVSETFINKLKNKMQEIIDKDLPFTKQIIRNSDAINYYNSVGETEKSVNIENATNEVVTLYKLMKYYNYFYTNMPTSTGVLKMFELSILDSSHLILRYPTPRSNEMIPDYKHYEKTLEAFETYRDWLEKIKVPYVSNLNKIVADCKTKDFILMNHIISENQFFKIAGRIAEKNLKNKVKTVFVAGPSSSGKTTSAKKMAVQLKAFGLNPFVISADDFYKERNESPRLPDGRLDFESIDALDLELMDKTLGKLINFESVQLPTFNFFTGMKEYKNEPVKLTEDDVIIFEGLHCMNNRITDMIPKENQYKIYISPFPGLNIDRHNYISSVDLRLIRRMVRDNVYRGYPVEKTIAMWQDVREGEEKYVYPYQDQADDILNTSLVYEIGVLRVFAEPLLSSVPVSSSYYQEARRLLGFLRGFFPISPEYVSRDTVLREFIGDSIFH